LTVTGNKQNATLDIFDHVHLTVKSYDSDIMLQVCIHEGTRILVIVRIVVPAKTTIHVARLCVASIMNIIYFFRTTDNWCSAAR
jgi:hypothetical protein